MLSWSSLIIVPGNIGFDLVSFCVSRGLFYARMTGLLYLDP
jgi:hypothetical protein